MSKASRRSKNNKRQSDKKGLSPGTMMHIGEKKADKTLLSVFDYTPLHCEELNLREASDTFVFKQKKGITWINIDGLHDLKTIEVIGKHFDIHQLSLEDIVNTLQRPKIEEYENYVFLVLKSLAYQPSLPNPEYQGDSNASQQSSVTGAAFKMHHLEIEQISFVLGHNYLLTFQEAPGDTFDGVRRRLKQASSSLRQSGTDYLLYALIDTIVDNYFVVCERLSEQIEMTEEQILHDAQDSVLADAYAMKKEIAAIRKAVYPLRDVLTELNRNESQMLSPNMKWYVRDVLDHCLQVMENIENYREAVMSLIELQMSTMSQRMNEVMKTLTIVSTIFIPLTFIAGIYGMNFDNMPELHWQLGYFGVWSVMIGAALFMFYYFRKKKWL